MTKLQEIELIEKLIKGDGYFAEYFKMMAPTMIENIRNDYPIMMGTTLDNQEDAISRLRSELGILNEAVSAKQSAITDMKHELMRRESKLNSLLMDLVKANNPIVHGYYDFKEVLKAKITAGVDLDQEDRNLLISLAKL